VWSLLGGHPRIARVLLSRPDLPADAEVFKLFPRAAESSCAEVDALSADIEAFLSGEELEFGLEAVRLDLCSPFQQAVLRAEHGIPRGSVSTYGLLAAHIGRAGAARAVGTALATNPFPIIVPCHRAVRSDRHLGGYQGGMGMKRALLAAEGLAFDREGRVAVRRFRYAPNMERRHG